MVHSFLRAAAIVVFGFTSVTGFGQMTFTSGSGLTQTQNFDGLPTNVTNNTLASSQIGQNWYRHDGSSQTQALTGNVVLGSNTNGLAHGVYNCATAASGGTSSDRAVGPVASGSGTHRIGVELKNTTGSTISKFDISANCEKYRNGSDNSITERVVFEYSLNATSLNNGTWTAVTALDLVEPSNTNTQVTTGVDGNDAANKAAISGSISSLTLANNASIWIRWRDADVTGTDALLALDDVSITATIPVSSTINISSASQVAAQYIYQNTTNNVISAIEVANTSGASVNLTDISFTTTGTYLPADLAATNPVKLYYTSTSTFSTSNLLGSKSSAASGSGETFAFTGLSQAIANNGTAYLWLVADVRSTATAGRTIAVNATAVGDVTVSAGTKASTATAGGTQTVSALPTLTLSSLASLSYCKGATISVPFTFSGNYNSGNTFTAQLSDATGSFTSPIATASGSASPLSITIPTGAATGVSYRVRVISTDPVVTSSNSSAITVNTGPTNTVTGDICQGVQKPIVNGTGAGQFSPYGGTWTVVTASAGSVLAASGNDYYYDPGSTFSGSVTLRYTYPTTGTGCSVDATFTVNANPVNNTTTTAICNGGTVSTTKTLAGTGGNSASSWSINSVASGGNGAISGASSTAGTYTPAANTSGTVVIRYTNTTTGCYADKSFTVNQAPSISPASPSLCPSASTAITVTNTGGGTFSSLTGTATGATLTFVSTGNYTLASSTTTGTANATFTTSAGCAANLTGTVTSVTNSTTTAAICTNGSKALSGTPGGGTWSLVSGTDGSIAGTTYTPATTGSKTIRYTVGSCFADVTFTVNQAATFTSPVSLCAGGTASSVLVTNTASGSFGTFSGSATGTTLTGSFPSYTVTSASTTGTNTANFTAANGCITPLTVVVTANTLSATAKLTAYDCSNGKGTVTVAATGGTSPYTGTGTFSAVSQGTQSYTITDNAGCSTTKSVTVNDFIPASPTVTTPVTYCQNQTAIPLTASGLLTGYNYTWSTSASGGTTSSSAPTPSTNTPGTTSYYVGQKLPLSIAFTGWNSNTDEVTFVALSNIPAGQVIYFTDNGWNTSTGSFRGATSTDGDGNEGLMKFTANVDIMSGRVMTVGNVSDPDYSFSFATIPGVTQTFFASGYNISSTDQIYAFTNTNSNNPLFNTATMTHLAVFDNTGTFVDATTSSSGNIPPGLTNGLEAVTFNAGAGSVTIYFNDNTVRTPGQWRTFLNTQSNFTVTSSNLALPTSNLNVTDGGCESDRAKIDVVVNPLLTWYQDTDADGYGNPAVTQSACTQPANYVSNNTDCDPTNGTKWQSATLYIDNDNDNYDNGTAVVCYGASIPTGYKASTLGSDCNDNDNTKNATFSFYADTDGDGFGAGSLQSGVCAVNSTTAPTGYSTNNTDCAPLDNTKWQSLSLYVDADNDGYTNGTATVCMGASVPAGYKGSTLGIDCDDNNGSIWQSALLYIDADNDNYTNGTATVCYGASVPAGYKSSTLGGDCDDNNSSVWQDLTLYIDNDNDNYDNGTALICFGASIPAGYKASTLGSDCNDNDNTKHATFSFYADADADGFGAGSLQSGICAVNSTTPPTGYSVNNTDCAPADNTKWQSATLYIDNDNDNYHNGTAVVCYGASVPTGYTAAPFGADCNDNNAALTTNCGTVNTWLGNTTQWSAPGNWSFGYAPASCSDDALIPSSPVGGNYPTIGIVSPTVGNIEIQNGARITANNVLKVCGNITGGTNALNSPVILGSSYVELVGTSQQTLSGLLQLQTLRLNNAAGAVITNATGNLFDVFVALELQSGELNTGNSRLRFRSISETESAVLDNFSSGFGGSLTGTIQAERYYGAPTANSYNQHFMSSPLNAMPLIQFGANGTAGYIINTACDETQSNSNSPYGSVFEYDETNGTNCGFEAWKVLTGGNAVNGKGYSVAKTGSGVLTVNGTPNTDPAYIVTGITKSNWTNTTAQGRLLQSGWNLVGNPYLAELDIQHPLGPGIDAQIQIWNSLTGQFDAYVIGDPVVPIAPFQAFYVRKSGALGNMVLLDGNNRSRNVGTTFYQQNNAEELTVFAKNNQTGLMDNTRVRFTLNATSQFDGQLDANKLYGKLTNHTLYTLSGTEHMSRNNLHSIAETGTVPLSMEAGTSSTYTFTFDGLQSFDPTSYITLEDLVTGAVMDVRQTPSYTFSMNKGDNPNRFVLHFTPAAKTATTDATCEATGMLNIEQPGTANWNYTVANSQSATIATGILNQNSPVSLSVPAGNYTVTLVDNNNYTVVKTITVNGNNGATVALQTSAMVVEEMENITFTANATNATDYTWNFGDGTIITNQTAAMQYQYNAPGVYTVSVLADNGYCNAIATQTVTVNKTATGIGNLTENTLQIYSYHNRVVVDFGKEAKNATVAIFNLLGQELSNDKTNNKVYTHDLNNLEAGYVIVKVLKGDDVTTKKVLITNK